jgi:hypothetical protein
VARTVVVALKDSDLTAVSACGGSAAITRWRANSAMIPMILLSRALPSRDPANASPSDGTQDDSSADPSQAHRAAGPRLCPFPDGNNAIHLLCSDGIKRYSVGSFVFMIGVITPFT